MSPTQSEKWGVACLHPAFGPIGGAELLVLDHARLLAERGVPVGLAAFEIDEATWATRLRGLPVRRLAKHHWTDFAALLGQQRKLAWRGRRVRRALTDCRVVIAYNAPCHAMIGASSTPFASVWHCNEPSRRLYATDANPHLTEAAQRQPCPREPVAVTKHRVILEERKLRGVSERTIAGRRYDRDGVAGLDRVWALSEFSRDNIERIYGRRDVEIIYPLVRFPEVLPPARRGMPRDILRVLVLSRLEVKKNIDTVLRAVELLASSLSIRVEVVGEGPARLALESLASELGIADRVLFHGFLPGADLDRVYAECDVFVLVPFDEPFGMVLPEAAARGLLLVSADHGGPAEIMDGGRLGWPVDGLSPEPIAEALREIRALPDAEVDRRRERAREACLSRFGRATIEARLLELLSSLGVQF